MFGLKIVIQLISIYRAVAISVFVLFYAVLSNGINSLILITAISSDLLDGYLAKKYKLTSTGGKLLDLFSDKYLNCILIIFLIVEGYSIFPLLLVLAKEIFVLSFRSIVIDGKFVISTNRVLGGIMSGSLWVVAFLHINNFLVFACNNIIMTLGVLNLLYLIFKIVSNFTNLKKVFKVD